MIDSKDVPLENLIRARRPRFSLEQPFYASPAIYERDIERVFFPTLAVRGRADAELIKAEFANHARMAQFACERGISVLSGTIRAGEMPRTLAKQMNAIIQREGGLEESTGVLAQRLNEYR